MQAEHADCLAWVKCTYLEHNHVNITSFRFGRSLKSVVFQHWFYRNLLQNWTGLIMDEIYHT